MADKIKLVLAALLLAAGVAGFYYLGDSAAIVRLAAIAARRTIAALSPR